MLKDYELNKPTLETERLLLRPLSEADVPDLQVLEKCGFVREGTVRQGKMVSVYCDYAIYGMLRRDWEKGDK